ncbi:MAG: ABC transporter permease, partial [Alphaproteobacteria bacterium]
MSAIVKPLIVFLGLMYLWQAAVSVFEIAPFILPGPIAVIEVAIARADTIAEHAGTTLVEILLGLAFGTLLG